MINNTGVERDRSILSQIAPYLVLVLMLIASVWFWRFWVNLENTREQKHFDEYSTRISQDITNRMDTYKNILQGGVGTFLSSTEVSREKWRAYVEYRKVRTLYPGIQGFGFAKVIAPSELARHVASIRAEGFPQYKVWPEGERTIYTSIIYLEPFDARNQRALGYDMFSEPVRRTAMERSRDTAMPSLSGRVTLVQQTDKDIQAGYLLYIPVFGGGGMNSSSVEARRSALKGYVYAPFRIKDLMRGIFADTSLKVAFELYDGTKIVPESLLFDSRKQDDGSSKDYRVRFSSQKSLQLYGQTWSLVFHSTPQFDAEKEPHLS